MLSFVIPVYNEQDSLEELHRSILENLLSEEAGSYEIWFSESLCSV